MKNFDITTTPWEFLKKFLKNPLSTTRDTELDVKSASLLVAIFPVSMFLALWALINNVLTTLANVLAIEIGSLFNGDYNVAANIRADLVGDFNWMQLFANTLLTSLLWFASITFIPVFIAKLFKIEKKVCYKQLFTSSAIITLPMSILLFAAAFFGVVSLMIWLLIIAVLLIIPFLLHYAVIKQIFAVSSDVAFYIVLLTQAIIILLVSLWSNLQATNLIELFGQNLFW